jgi:DNA-binding CsgD family transcriptional regulator
MKERAAAGDGCQRRLKRTQARLAEAQARAEEAEARTARAKTRAELAEIRAEQAETRIESAKTRSERAEARAEEAETILQRVTRRGLPAPDALSSRLLPPRLLDRPALKQVNGQKNSIEQLTERQREILELIAQGQNTKQIAAALGLSPKTVEYHRVKLMNALNVHDVAGLVRLALREGLVVDI